MASPNDRSPSEPSGDPRQRILLVTGLSGAGKTTALAVLEDLGWETIDNFPIRLLEGLIGPEGDDEAGPRGDRHGPLAIGFDSRTRGFKATAIIELAKSLSERPDLTITFLFIDCSGAELERRYNETRRRHPMAQGRPVSDGVAAERELLEPLRRWADMVIDTSALSTNELQAQIRERFGPGEHESGAGVMTLTVSSFGFARGMPPLADLVFDMRFLDNPHWVEGLRELTGRDAPVGEHIERDPDFAPVFEQVKALITRLLPRYRQQGKSYVHVAFGCTGGRHRSVYTAERMGEALREAGFSPTVRHRNLSSRVADELERQPRH